jgi:hypothetical protein
MVPPSASGDSMLSIQRRNQEATKELKENVGDAVNHFFKP